MAGKVKIVFYQIVTVFARLPVRLAVEFKLKIVYDAPTFFMALCQR